MRKRYALAVVGLETNSVVPLLFHRFRSLKKATVEVARLNDKRDKNPLTEFAVWDRKEAKLVDD